MYKIKMTFIFILFFLMSCSETMQRNGLSQKTAKQIKIKIGETSKQNLIKNYGPPTFESVFRKNIFYYVSHTTSYETFEERKTKKLIVYEITLNENNIVENFKEFSEKDTLNVKVSDESSEQKQDFVLFWKDMLNNLRKRNVEN